LAKKKQRLWINNAVVSVVCAYDTIYIFLKSVADDFNFGVEIYWFIFIYVIILSLRMFFIMNQIKNDL